MSKAATRKDGKPKKGARTRAAALDARAAAPDTLAAAARSLLHPIDGEAPAATAAVLDRLWLTIEDRRVEGDVEASHSARLLARGPAKVAQKLGEEAVECVIEAALGRREATILESADLLYHLTLVWVGAGIRPAEVWAELARREGMSGVAEKAARPRDGLRGAHTSKLP